MSFYLFEILPLNYPPSHSDILFVHGGKQIEWHRYSHISLIGKVAVWVLHLGITNEFSSRLNQGLVGGKETGFFEAENYPNFVSVVLSEWCCSDKQNKLTRSSPSLSERKIRSESAAWLLTSTAAIVRISDHICIKTCCVRSSKAVGHNHWARHWRETTRETKQRLWVVCWNFQTFSRQPINSLVYEPNLKCHNELLVDVFKHVFKPNLIENCRNTQWPNTIWNLVVLASGYTHPLMQLIFPVVLFSDLTS